MSGTASGQDKPQKPDWVVKDLYVENTINDVNPDEYFTKEMAEAVKANKAAVPFDYRFDSPGADGGALDFTTEAVADNHARVRADFLLNGKPRKILYTVCKQEDGKWRIAGVQTVQPANKWDLRTMVKLTGPAGC